MALGEDQDLATGRPRRFRFSKALRIRKGKEFDRVFDEGERVSDSRMMIVFAPNGLSHSRLGILASRKLGNAVKRNRVKRILREAFRLSREELPSGFDFVVVPRQRKQEWTLEATLESLEELAGKAGR